MKRIILIISILVFVSSCSTRKAATAPSGLIDYGSPKVKQELLNDYVFKVTEYSNDPEYGYTTEKPIMVGGSIDEGAMNERRFLNALEGPNGEKISYNRRGSCCAFHSKNAAVYDTGVLDMYEIMYPGLEEPILLYINMYDSDHLKIPVGFKAKY